MLTGRPRIPSTPESGNHTPQGLLLNVIVAPFSHAPLVFSGASTFTGTVSVQGGSISVGSFNSVSGGTATSNLGAPTDAASGTISLGLTSTSTTLDYSGFGETTDRVIRLAGTTGGAILRVFRILLPKAFAVMAIGFAAQA